MVSIFSSIACTNNWIKNSSKPLPRFKEILYSSLLLSVKSERKNWKTYEFRPPYLVQINNSKTPHKYMSLNWKTMEAFTESNSSSPCFGFRIDSLEFYVESESILEQWIFYLSKVCILTEFDEDFVIIKNIGKGSTSVVYLADQIDKNEQFAVKTLKKEEILRHNNGVKNLADEIRIMREMNHENITKLYYVYENTEFVYMVMEYLPFGDLYNRIRLRNRFDEDTCCKFIKNLLETLEYMHSLDIVHRDLKPENIIMCGECDFEFKIIDFGLAYLSSATQSMKCGSPGYVAPEILCDQRYDSKIDIFSAGVILYVLLYGKHPFDAGNADKILKKNSDCNANVNKKYSQFANQVILLMMQKNPELRPSASQLLEHPWFKKTSISSCGSIISNSTMSLINNQSH